MNYPVSGREQAREKNQSLIPVGVVLPPPGFAQPRDQDEQRQGPSE